MTNTHLARIIIDLRRKSGVCVLCGNRSPGGYLHKDCDESTRMTDAEFDAECKRIEERRAEFYRNFREQTDEIRKAFESAVGSIQFCFLGVSFMEASHLLTYDMNHGRFVVRMSRWLFDREPNSKVIEKHSASLIHIMKRLRSSAVEVTICWN